jgi:hypothetical protein
MLEIVKHKGTTSKIGGVADIEDRSMLTTKCKHLGVTGGSGLHVEVDQEEGSQEGGEARTWTPAQHREFCPMRCRNLAMILTKILRNAEV